jgi:hypothetical protein
MVSNILYSTSPNSTSYPHPHIPPLYQNETQLTGALPVGRIAGSNLGAAVYSHPPCSYVDR